MIAYLRKKIDNQFVERLSFFHSTKLAELVVAWNAVFPTALNGDGSQIGSVRLLAAESKPIQIQIRERIKSFVEKMNSHV